MRETSIWPGSATDSMLEHPDRQAINGALFKLGKRVTKPDKAMADTESCRRLWEELVRLTEPV